MKNIQSSIENRVLRILLLAFCFLLTGTALAGEEAVFLQTQAITTKQPGTITLGDISISALNPGVITPAKSLLLRIPDNFPAIWETQVTTLSLSSDSSSGLVNESITYPDQKTLRIQVTQNWSEEARITISNLKLAILEFPSYEELFAGEVSNCAGLSLYSGAFKLAESNERILLKISPLYSGDDGWDGGEPGGTGPVVGYEFCNFESTQSGFYLPKRGFQAVVYAVDTEGNWVDSSDTVLLSSKLSTDPNTNGDVTFYQDSGYDDGEEVTSYPLNQGYTYIYAKDGQIEDIVLEATHQTEAMITGESEELSISAYKYGVTSNIPQPTVNMQWEEDVQLQDPAGQDIDTDEPGKVVPVEVEVSSDGNVKFYSDSNYSGSGFDSLNYSLGDGGTCTIYMKGPITEVVHLLLDDEYDSYSHSGGGTSKAFSIAPAAIDIHLDFSYDEQGGIDEQGKTTDKLTIRAWMVKDGLLVTTDLGAGSLDIYNFNSWVDAINVDTAPGDGIYWFTVEDTEDIELSAAQGYFAIATITYQGLTYKGGGNFYITMDKQVLSEVDAISAKIDELKKQAAGLSTDFAAKVGPTLSDIEDKTDQAITATEQTIPAKIDSTRDEIQPHIVSRILNTETEVISGGELNIRYRTYADTEPVLDVYDPDHNIVLASQAMSTVTEEGVYEYALKFSSSWGKGFFTVICSESTHGTLDGVTISVIGTSMERIGRDVTAVLGSTGAIDEVSRTQARLDTIFSDKLNKLNASLVQAIETGVSAVAAQLGKEQAKDIYMMMSEISESLKTEGVVTEVKGDIEQLYDISEESMTDMGYLRNKFIQMENLLEINRQMIDSVTYEPIIQSWYEFR